MKSWYQSKTVWFNALYGVIALAGAFGFAEFQPNAEVVAGVGILISAVNLVLRVWFTKEPVG